MPDLSYQDKNGVSADELRETLLPALRASFELEIPPDGHGDGFLELTAPFCYAGGERIPIGVEVRDGQWYVSDHGATFLRHQDIYAPDYVRGFIRATAGMYGAGFVGDAVVMRLPNDGACADTVGKFAALIQHIEDRSNSMGSR